MKTAQNDDALVAALLRLLKKPYSTWYGGERAPGHWHGSAKDLFSALIEDERFYAEVDRQHDAAEIRAAIKKRAVELHKLGIIVTLKGQQVSLEKVKRA